MNKKDMETLNKLPVHSPWAFTENEAQKSLENRAAYKAIEDLVVHGDAPIDGKVVVSIAKPCYGHTEYRIVSNPLGMSTRLIALWCDRGNLCFGHRVTGSTITVWTD